METWCSSTLGCSIAMRRKKSSRSLQHEGGGSHPQRLHSAHGPSRLFVFSQISEQTRGAWLAAFNGDFQSGTVLQHANGTDACPKCAKGDNSASHDDSPQNLPAEEPSGSCSRLFSPNSSKCAASGNKKAPEGRVAELVLEGDGNCSIGQTALRSSDAMIVDCTGRGYVCMCEGTIAGFMPQASRTGSPFSDQPASPA